ncbi:unnamed protein product [Cylicocyclus nassatus]|uniref:EndoU domain-containing protein n=1 Tax=Cylicocyclus nassatus TaxID=53992 RepID=A0AA36MHS6_CYLNA|nr:unnamed protein product [Cylicocyclus nassatus]
MGKAVLLLFLVVQCYALSEQGFIGRAANHFLGLFNRFFQRGQNAGGNIQPLVDKMLEADIYKAGPNDYKVNYGNPASGTKDQSKNDLFYDVNEAIFKQPVYDVLIKLVENGVFYNDVCETEKPMDGFRKTQIQKLLDTWTDTKVFKLAYEYLHSKNEPHSTTFAQLKEFLFNFWFGTYSRCKGTMGSSGFEHVFTGEWKKGTVGGHHSWVTYYLAQKKGKINYHGYYTKRGITTGTFQYKWQSYMKKKGGMLFGTSPAFDFSLFTVCALLHPGANTCRYSINNVPLAVTSYTQSCNAGTCLSTAYPTND